MLLLGCDKPERIPAYIRVEPFGVEAAAGGKEAHALEEGWVYVNEEFLGAYPLPASVPALAEGEAQVRVFPGVHENGIANTPNIYPYLRAFAQRVTLTPGQAVTVRPTTGYVTEAKFPWELSRTTFDGGSILTLEDLDGDPERTFVITAEGGFAGKGILAQVEEKHPSVRFATESVALPVTLANEVWLELQHQNDMPFSVSLIGVGNTTGRDVVQPVFQFNPSAGWNKIYLNLTEYLIEARSTRYRLLFSVDLPRNGQGQFTQPRGTVKLDNIRLVHF